jgi:starch synthase (maltosyl-transferring)
VTQGPRIYNLFPLLAGPLPGWRPHLERAAGMGFTWVFVNAFYQAGFSGSLYSVKDYYAVDARFVAGSAPPAEQLAEMLRQASELGLSVMMDLVINHTAFDSPLLREHPAWFQRDAMGEIVHPGAKDGKRRVVWKDLAEVDNVGSPDRAALWTYWRELALHYAGLGVRGFRCDAAYQVPAELWRDLIGAVKTRHPDTLFFAETLGCTPKETLATACAGFDFIFNSSKWWDFREPWCLEQYAITAPVVPSVSFPESHDTPRLAAEFDGDRAAVVQRYAFAAAFSTGVMMPMGFEYGFRKPLHVVQTTPQDWEQPAWDLTGTIGQIHEIKAAMRPLNEDGPITPLSLDGGPCYAFWKETQDGSQAALVVLNLERTATARIRVPVGAPASMRQVARDPTTGALRALPDTGELELPPAGVLIVHEVDQDGRATGIHGVRLQRPGDPRPPGAWMRTSH